MSEIVNSRICRINDTFEFNFGSYGERLDFNENTQQFESTLTFQTYIGYDSAQFTNDFIKNMPTREISKIEIIIPGEEGQEDEIIQLSSRFNFLAEVYTDYPEGYPNENRGHVHILSKSASIE